MPNRRDEVPGPHPAVDASARSGRASRRSLRTRTTRTLAAVSALSVVLVTAACGATADSTADEPATGSLPVVDHSATDVLGAVPSTTVPVPLDAHACTGEPVEVVERILIERRIGGDSPICVPVGQSDEAAPSAPCWSTCADGSVFVDFDLDTTLPPVQRTNEVTGGVETVVPFAARYSTGDSTTTFAESLVVVPSEAPGEWEFVELLEIDLESETNTAEALAGQYLDAIRGGDFRTAAELMIGNATVPSTARDDLGRLADEGMLSGTSPAQIADALEQWCASGAACSVEPSLEVEVTSDHDVRIIATYELTTGTFETTFAVTDGSIEGLPLKVH